MAPWMINCKEYSKLVSKGLDGPLSLWERVSIKIHRWVCPPCQHVKRQLLALGQACRVVPPESESEQDQSSVLSDEACARIKAALKKVPQK